MTSIAVSGASGKLGQNVVQSIRRITGQPLVALTRTPESYSAKLPGLSARHADFDQPAGLVDAMSGIDRLLIISTGYTGADDRRVRQHKAAIDAAIAAGVRHIVYTSMFKADSSPLTGMVADHAATEAFLRATGIGYTILRNAFYDDLAHQLLARADAQGRFVHAAGAAGVAYATRTQCADAAAYALTDGFEGRRTLDITGSRAITMPELAALASAQRGRSYTAVPLTPEALSDRLVSASVPKEHAALLAWIDRGLAEGAMAPASDDFERLTGRKAPPLVL
ncbi:NAD(P)H-binding protein [Devosia sp.]|uniref:NAD(P)H-binding protein n=1 Tax=Devosia sp. TaxID=1871048 RepID=UPI003A8D003C